jgi:hypothetical protein
VAQKTDVVVMANGDRNTGEFRSYREGDLYLTTSDQGDIKIKWNRILSITSDKTFEIELVDGSKLFGRLSPSEPPGRLVVSGEGFRRDLGFLDVVRIAPLSRSVWIGLNGSADLGFTYTDANHFVQFNFSGEAEYRSRSWEASTRVSVFLSEQEGTTSSHRASWYLDYQHFLANRWFVGALTQFDHNKELGIDLRALAGLAVGRHLVQTNRTSFDALVGIAGAHERPIEGEGASSAEAILSAQYSTFQYEFPKLRFGIAATVYPSLTESGRVRVQADGWLRRDIVTDFYVSISVFDSYDSRPPTVGAAKNDWGPVVSAGYKF